MLIIESYKIPDNSTDMMREMVYRGETAEAVFYVIQRVYGEITVVSRRVEDHLLEK